MSKSVLGDIYLGDTWRGGGVRPMSAGLNISNIGSS